MTTTPAKDATPRPALAASWTMPDVMAKEVRPGDQIVFSRPGKPVMQEIVAILTSNGKPCCIIRASDAKPGKAAPADTPRTITTIQIVTPTSTMLLTLVEPLATGRCWMVTPNEILLSKGSDQ